MTMGEKNPVYVGVDIIHAAGRLRRAFVYAALDDERELLAIGHGDKDEILAYLGGQQTAYVAINAPRMPNTGTANNTTLHQNKLPFEKPSHQVNARLCEYLLQQQGLDIDSTPDKTGSCPRWMQRGFDLYQHLEDFGYAPYPNQEGTRHSLETHADGIFWRLLKDHLPLPASLEGRLQRQLILGSIEMPVPDAMDFFLEITRFKLIQGELPDENIHSIEELNALAAAHIAWQSAHHPNKLDLLGDPNEGQIALPIDS